jgi:glyoxylate/hydroxypyruvate reductase A
MTLLIEADREAGFLDWQRCFREAAPDLKIRWWADPEVDPAEVLYVFCYAPEPGRLSRFPNLRLICSASVGVDNIVTDGTWPTHVPLVRMGCSETAQRMSDYVAWACLSINLNLPRIALAQRTRTWDKVTALRTIPETRVGILGMGNLGAKAAQSLRDFGFSTAGWSRTRKSLPGIESFVGSEELQPFLQRADILVCLLPGTPETVRFLSEDRLARLPVGAGLVNVGRGSHVDVEALTAALDSGHLSGAVLDVFETEPLAADDPLWGHPKVVVTSHLASTASRESRARYAASVIAAFERGDDVPNRFDPVRGY